MSQRTAATLYGRLQNFAASIAQSRSCFKHSLRWLAGRHARTASLLSIAAVSLAAQAQDASRGARLYVQLPTVPSCISCHGPDPSQGRNNLLLAADNPQHLLKALNSVGAMGFLKSLLLEADVNDIAAYLGRVASVQAVGSPIAMWPTTVDFGSLSVGASSSVQQVELRNLRAETLPIDSARLEGPGASAFTLQSDCGASLAPGASCRLRLQAVPAAPSRLSATLAVQSGSVAPWVTGVAVVATASAAGVLSVDPPASTLEFLELPLGESVVREFRLLNHGTAPATLGETTLTGPARPAFQVQGDCGVGLALAPGAGCTMRVRFAPIEPGVASATLQWRSDAANPSTLALAGSGRATSTAPPPTATPTTPAAEPGSSGGGCATGPTVRKFDPVLLLALLACALALGWRRDGATHYLHCYDVCGGQK